MKKQNGITLIALVITIIVLLILAGVSIAMLTGDNGILNKATEAGTKTEEGEAEEAVKLATNVVLADVLDPQATTKEISAAAIVAANNDSNVTLVADDSIDMDADTSTEPPTNKKIGIKATIGKNEYKFRVDQKTGKVDKVTE